MRLATSRKEKVRYELYQLLYGIVVGFMTISTPLGVLTTSSPLHYTCPLLVMILIVCRLIVHATVALSQGFLFNWDKQWTPYKSNLVKG